MADPVDVTQNPDGTVRITGNGWQVDVITCSTTWARPVGIRALDVLLAAGSGGDSPSRPGQTPQAVHRSLDVADSEFPVTIANGGAGFNQGTDGVAVLLSRW